MRVFRTAPHPPLNRDGNLPPNDHNVKEERKEKEEEEELSLEDLWTFMVAKNVTFPAKFKVYSFFRERKYAVPPLQVPYLLAVSSVT